MNYLKGTILFMIFGFNLISQNDSLKCYSVELNYKQTSLELGNYFLPNQFRWFEIDLKDYYENPAIYIENISLGDSSFIEVYQEVYCDSLETALISSEINDNIIEFDLSLLSENNKYYILIRSPRGKGGLFSIHYGGDYKLDGCHYEVNRKNGIRKAQKLPLSTYNVEKCWSSCNRYIKSKLMLNQFREGVLDNIKWYHIDSELNPAFLNISGFSFEDNIEVFIGRKSKGGRMRILHRQKSENLTLDLDYLPTSGANDHYIGIRSVYLPYCNYQMCISYAPFENDNSCIDYASEGDTLFPVSTSLGSDLEGPYIAGEEIIFKYRINQWRPVNHSWLHAIIPLSSGPWTLKMDTIAIDSITDWQISGEEGLDTLGFWNWMYEDSIQHFSSLNDRFKGPGWYASFDGAGPTGIVPKTRWGKKIDYHVTQTSPYFEVEFTVVVDDSLDCDSMYICEVEARAYADHEAGIYLQDGCNNSAEIFQCTVKCCDVMPEALILDSIICDEEELYLEVGQLIEPGRLVSHDLNLDHSVGNGLFKRKISTGLKKAESYDLWLIVDDERYCEDSLPLSFTVAPKPDVDIGDDLIICAGEAIQMRNKERNGDQVLHNEWRVRGRTLPEEGLSHEELFLVSVHNRLEVNLIVENEYDCYHEDTALVNIRDFGELPFVDIELCPEDVDSVLNLAHLKGSGECKISVIMPSGEKVNRDHLTLSEFGTYDVEVDCDGCRQSYSFNVVHFQPTDTIILTICNNQQALAAIEPGLTGGLSTRSKEEKAYPCSQYKKDTVYKFEYISGCLDEVDESADIFPNPASETVHIVNKQDVDKKYMVMDAQGVVVKSGELPAGLMVTFGGLELGVYRIMVYTDSGSYSIYKQIISN